MKNQPKRGLRQQQLSVRKLKANHRNAQSSTGPRDTSHTRRNAVTHGLLAHGITELDDPELFYDLCSQLQNDFNPATRMEVELVRHVALCRLRLVRAGTIEAELIGERLHPPVTDTIYPDGNTFLADMEESFGKTVVTNAGSPARLPASTLDELMLLQRYQTSISSELFRTLNQLERYARMRRGDNIAAPAALDVNVHHGSDDVALFGNSHA